MSPSTRGTVSAARERLLRTASELFYTDGIRAVGIDRVVDVAGITRATLYRHFPSKDDLVVAYLGTIHDTLRTRAGDVAGEARLRHVTGALDEMICARGFRGCAFINAAAEFPDPTSPVHRAVTTHRTWLMDLFRTDLATLGHPDPHDAAGRLMLLRDGAMVAGYLGDTSIARVVLERGVDVIVAEAR